MRLGKYQFIWIGWGEGFTWPWVQLFRWEPTCSMWLIIKWILSVGPFEVRRFVTKGERLARTDAFRSACGEEQ